MQIFLRFVFIAFLTFGWRKFLFNLDTAQFVMTSVILGRQLASEHEEICEPVHHQIRL